MNEADTRATLIEPKLRAAGWTDRYVTREYFYQRDHQYAPGRILDRLQTLRFRLAPQTRTAVFSLAGEES